MNRIERGSRLDSRRTGTLLLLTALIALPLAGCSDDDAPPPAPTSTPTVFVGEPETPTPVATRTPTATSGIAPEPTSIPGLCAQAFEDSAFGSAAGVAATPTPVALSTCSTDAERNVTIGTSGCGPNVYVDKSFTGSDGFGAITIADDGKLAFLDGRSTQLDVGAIVVAGKLAAGTEQCPIENDDVVTINFTDAVLPNGAVKGLSVVAGGTLSLRGATGVAAATPAAGANPQAPSWTYLAAPAGPVESYGPNLGVASPVGMDGATVIQVADTVDWRAGQWIVVAGTDFSPDSAEFVQIDSVDCTSPMGCTITLKPHTPLVHYHFGGAAPDTGNAAFNDSFAQNYGVDERAEVGLISRNVKLTSTITGSDIHNGGEIMIMSGFDAVAIQGVEIEKFGKDSLAHYPIHFHMVDTVEQRSVLVDSNSVHHSYNKCFVLHATNGVTLSNNVCARAVGHLFYMESGTEVDNTIIHNLGIGAMSNAFSIPAGNTAAMDAFWTGDYLVNGVGGAAGNGYDGFNIPFTDDMSTVVGTASTPSGFWITSPGKNVFHGNSVAGCQALGRGFWILPAPSAAFTPLAAGAFAHNRAHGCYTGFDTASDDGVVNAQLYTPQGDCLAGAQKGMSSSCDVVTQFDAPTATRNRNRGIWVRASWYAILDARLATNRDGVSLVSSGGTEGSPPGEWGLLKDAIIVGMSANNPLRWGPCPYPGQNSSPPPTPAFGGAAGCWEMIQGNGFPIPTPSWSLFGVMFYDGPARIEHVHFVNFKRDITPYLTGADLGYLNYYSANNAMPCQTDPNVKFVYEGDAAMGWFQSNVNSYPPTQYVEDVTYANVDLRHQVYTESVEQSCAPSGDGGNFRDGDKFTVILDHDTTLTGLQVVQSTPGPTPVADVHPISLNNIPFLAGPGTADECLSLGNADEVLEGRPTSLISPYSYATLELQALTPPCDGTQMTNCINNNVMIFAKDQEDYGGTIQFTDVAIDNQNNTLDVNCGGTAMSGDPGVVGHACVALTGRNGNGIYEPKLVDGLGYTVGATAGLPASVSLMFVDASVPGGISADNPFQARVGLCYLNEGATAPPASAFTVYKGSRSFAGPNGNVPTLEPDYYNQLACNGLDNVLCINSVSDCFIDECPSDPFYFFPSPTPSPTTEMGFAADDAAVTATPTASPTVTPTQTPRPALPQVASIEDLNDPTLCPNGECWFYDETSGLLFLNLTQEQPNAGGAYSSPLGSCGGTANGICAEESFYSCPAAGCQLYTIYVDGYDPAGKPSVCKPYGGSPDYTQSYPPDLNQLAYDDGTPIQVQQTGSNEFPHQELVDPPSGLCPENVPPTPNWPAAPAASIPAVFTLGLPPNVSATITGTGVQPITSTTLTLLQPSTSYTLSAAATSGCGTPSAVGAGTPTPTPQICACQQAFTVNANGQGFTSSGNNCCQMGTSSTSNTLGVAGPPYTCAGP